jgi:hypothetical protein
VPDVVVAFVVEVLVVVDVVVAFVVGVVDVVLVVVVVVGSCEAGAAAWG